MAYTYKYPRPAVTADCIVITKEAKPKVLLIQRGRLSDIHQIGVYSKVDRDPRGRTVTVAYLAIVDAPMAVKGQDDAVKAEWFSLSALPQLAFDHVDIMQDVINICKKMHSQGLQNSKW